MISTSTFYRHLSKLVYPCTYEFWLRDQAKTINGVLVIVIVLIFVIISRNIRQKTQESTGEGAKCAGDGRFDSPGWSAKFCNYFIQVLYFINFYLTGSKIF